MAANNVKVGDKFEINFTGASSLQGIRYEVYHVTEKTNYIPVSDILVFLKLISKDGFNKGAKLNDVVPLEHLQIFYKPVTTRSV